MKEMFSLSFNRKFILILFELLYYEHIAKSSHNLSLAPNFWVIPPYANFISAHFSAQLFFPIFFPVLLNSINLQRVGFNHSWLNQLPLIYSIDGLDPHSINSISVSAWL